jgi:hypothetical protein
MILQAKAKSQTPLISTIILDKTQDESAMSCQP